MTREPYIQCTFKQGDTEYVAHIPEHGAKLGYSMELDGKVGRWVVTSVGHDTAIHWLMAEDRLRPRYRGCCCLDF